jgi:hypothetical protein
MGASKVVFYPSGRRSELKEVASDRVCFDHPPLGLEFKHEAEPMARFMQHPGPKCMFFTWVITAKSEVRLVARSPHTHLPSHSLLQPRNRT